MSEGSSLGIESSISEECGFWTVVMKRKLTSDKPADVDLNTGKMINVGLAIHDDYTNACFHHVSLGYKLALDNPKAEVNVIRH